MDGAITGGAREEEVKPGNNVIAFEFFSTNWIFFPTVVTFLSCMMSDIDIVKATSVRQDSRKIGVPQVYD